MPETPANNEQTEDCEELDEDYFATIGNTFSVVDAWNENDEVQVKIEPDDESNHSKTSSKRLNNKDPETSRTSSRDSRSKESHSRSDRSRKSPERRRSPDRRRLSLERNRSRFSPPDRNRSFRNDRIRRSPPRNAVPFDRRRPASPDRNRNQHVPAKKSFLEEMQEKFAQEGRRDEQIDQMLLHGGRIDVNSAEIRSQSPLNFQMNYNNPQNQMPVFMNEQVMPQHFNPMAMPTMQNIHIPNLMNMQFPQMHPMTSPTIPSNVFPVTDMMQPTPLPVPPPISQISPPILYHSNAKQPVTIVRENVERPARKKTPSVSESGKNLIDILRQKSKQNTKTSGEEEIASKKAKVLERCKAAVDLISDLEVNKSKLPLTCILSKNSINKPTVTVNKSPLLISENNPRYLFQATPDQCFSVLENHPLRNIYGDTAEFAQYLKFDLHELSSTVAKESIVRPPAITTDSIPPTSSGIKKENLNIFVGKKTSTKDVQTDPMTCKKCHQMDIIKQSARSKACQTDEVVPITTEVKIDEQNDTNGFKVFIDAQTLADRNFEQHHALEVFSKAFGLDCPFIDRIKEPVTIQKQPSIHEENDERWNYTNPDNPNRGGDFFSTSPIHKRPASQRSFESSNSPLRYRQSKSPSRYHKSKSPTRFRSSNSPSCYRRSRSPSSRYRYSPQRRLNSPQRRFNSPPRVGRNRSVFERIGEKIPDNFDSPNHNFEDWNDDYDDQKPFRPYKIPSPRYNRSPEGSRRFRNRSRSLSRSPSRMSPKRYKSGGSKIQNRRGRY